MSEFRIIKCPKCDAALVELLGQKLDRCIQCGFIFNPVKNNNVAIKTKASKFSKVHKASPELKKLTTTLKTIVKQKTPVVVKKKVSAWITVVKWYLIIAFIIGVFSNLFSV